MPAKSADEVRSRVEYRGMADHLIPDRRALFCANCWSMTLRLACLSLLVLTLACAEDAAAATLNVDDDNQTGNEDGSAAHPYATVQAAVDKAATSGDTIQIAAGTYA